MQPTGVMAEAPVASIVRKGVPFHEAPAVSMRSRLSSWSRYVSKYRSVGGHSDMAGQVNSPPGATAVAVSCANLLVGMSIWHTRAGLIGSLL